MPPILKKYFLPAWVAFLTYLVFMQSMELYETKTSLNNIVTNSANFSPSSEGYTGVDTPIGKLTISLEKIEKYADGHKVFLQIGNPTSATISQSDITVKYGIAFENANDAFSDWHNNLKESKKTITKKLLPATWNDVEVTLSPSSDEETGFISVELTPKEISLNKK